jgi:hypothetical protein
MTGTEYNNMYSLGKSNVYIEDIDTIYNITGEENINLKDAILNLINEFFNNKKCKLITNYNQEMTIDNIERNYSGSHLDCAIIDTSLMNISNFTRLLADNSLTYENILNLFVCP